MTIIVSHGDDFGAPQVVLASPGVAGLAPVTPHIITVGTAFESGALGFRFLINYRGTLGAFTLTKEAFLALLALVWP